MTKFLEFIDNTKSSNKLWLPDTQVAIHHISMFVSRTVTQPTEYGTTKKTTVYSIEKANSYELKKACSNAVRSLQKSEKLDGYEYIMMTKRAEVWIKKHEDYINNIFFKVSINHTDEKVFITPILNIVETESDDIIFPAEPLPIPKLQRTTRRPVPNFADIDAEDEIE